MRMVTDDRPYGKDKATLKGGEPGVRKVLGPTGYHEEPGCTEIVLLGAVYRDKATLKGGELGVGAVLCPTCSEEAGRTEIVLRGVDKSYAQNWSDPSEPFHYRIDSGVSKTILWGDITANPHQSRGLMSCHATARHYNPVDRILCEGAGQHKAPYLTITNVPRRGTVCALAPTTDVRAVIPTPEIIKSRLEKLGASDVYFFKGQALHAKAPAGLVNKSEFTNAMRQSNLLVYHLTITDARSVEFRTLLDSPLLERTASLDLSSNDLVDRHVIQLAGSRRLKQLRWLSLVANQVTQNGAIALAQETVARGGNLVNLQSVNLAGNPCNPIARFSYDQGSIYDSELPSEGKELENIVGQRVPWLHPRVVNGREIFKNRYTLGLL